MFRFIVTALTSILLLSACYRVLTKEEAAAERTRATAEAQERGTSEAARRAASDENDARQKVIAQAASNIGPVADAVEVKGHPGLANVARDQKDAIGAALEVPLPKPTVTLAGLLADAEKERAKAQATADALQGKLATAARAAEEADRARLRAEGEADAARKAAQDAKDRADSEARRAWWASFGAGALGVLGTLAGLAAKFGLPGGSIVSAVLTPVLARRKDPATTAVAAGDVGRSALSALDAALAASPELAESVGRVVGSLTQGRAKRIEDLFKTVARAYVIDHAGAQADRVDQLLTQIRGEVIPTEGGVPTVLASVLRHQTIA